MFSRFFEPKAGRATPPSIDDDPVVAVPIPPLVTLLVALEKQKGAPLTEAEVLKARDGAVCMTMPRSGAWKMAEQRGYQDLNPETVWEEWQDFKRSA